jgi:hypothetical protein
MMGMGSYVRIAAIAGLLLAAPVSPLLAQTTGLAPTAPGIGLTPDHKRTIYRELGHETTRRIPEGSRVAIGAEIPDSLMLSEMPISVKDQIGLLRDFKFAKVADETIIIVDPAKRQIVDMVTKSEGTR